MTNEEKANEICKRHIFDSNLYNGCMEMAEWKDEEFAKERCEILQQAYDSANKTNETVVELVREKIRTDVKEWLIEHGLEWELKDILDLI